MTAAITTAIAQFNRISPLAPPYIYGYGFALFLLLLAAIVAIVISRQEGQDWQPKIVPVGYGTLIPGKMEGLIVENEAGPAYNVACPAPVLIGKDKVMFEDPVINRLTKEDGRRLFEVWVESHERGGMAGALFHEMKMEDVDEIAVQIKYADGRNPEWLRYTTICKLQRNVNVAGGITATFVKQQIEPHFLVRRLFLRRD